MRLVTSSDQQILDVLRACLGKAIRATFATAFATSAGAELLRPALAAFLGRGGSLEFYATLDGGAFTQPDFCKILLELEAQHPGRLDVYLYPDSSSLFHAKVFLFEGQNGDWSGVVGSANLTGRALSGGNFEVVAVGEPVSAGEVERFRAELSRRRVAGEFHRLTPESLGNMLAVFETAENAFEKDPEAQERARRAARNKRALVEQVLGRAPTMKLLPLPRLQVPPAAYVESLCGTGVGVATDDDLADLSVALNFGPFIRAGILAKESTKTIGFVSERTRKGHSFSLIDESVRKAVRTARDVIGKTLGFRAIDFGYLRWVPHRFFAEALTDIKQRREVDAAREAVNPDNPALQAYVASVRKAFRRNLARVVRELKIEPRADWADDAHSKFEIPSSATKKVVREVILEHVVKSHRDRLSDALVRSQLGRLTFAPRRFAFPLSQTSGQDEHYGHKHFLANVVFAWTDRMLRRTSEATGRGAVFEYLDARARLNRGRHNLEPASLAERAATWLDPETAIATAVEEFQTMYGAESFTWEFGDLVSAVPLAARTA